MVNRVELPQLTGLRFVAAASVVLFHLHLFSLNGAPLVLRRVAAYGNAAVGLFFILSGFILTCTYLGTGSSLDKRRFWLARFVRIYPVYLLALVIAAPVDIQSQLGAPSTNLPKLLASVLSTPVLVQAWIPQVALGWDAPSWSLSAEAFFYALFPFVAPRLMRVSVRAATIELAGLWLAALIAPIAYDLVFPDRVSAAGPSSDPWLLLVAYNPLMRLPEFVFGIILARLFLARPRGTRPAFNGMLAPAALAALVGLWIIVPNLPFLVVNNGLFDPLFALVIYGLATETGLMSRILSMRSIVFLGGASYSLYLLHFPALEVMLEFGDRTGLSRPVLELVYGAGVIIVASIMFRLVEEPARAALRARIDRFGNEHRRHCVARTSVVSSAIRQRG